jgi:hypothetical protein
VFISLYSELGLYVNLGKNLEHSILKVLFINQLLLLLFLIFYLDSFIAPIPSARAK